MSSSPSKSSGAGGGSEGADVVVSVEVLGRGGREAAAGRTAEGVAEGLSGGCGRLAVPRLRHRGCVRRRREGEARRQRGGGQDGGEEGAHDGSSGHDEARTRVTVV